MRITDLTGEYIEKVLHEDNISSYKKVHPGLFEHYFTYWAEEKHFKPTLDETSTITQQDLILSRLSHIEKKLKDAGFDTDSIEIILFVGSNCSNGHSFKYKDSFVTWIAIESYDTIDKIDTFLTHEILHSLHYSKNPEFYFSNKEEKESLRRQLVTEGLSTYLSMKVMGITKNEALWADFLDKEIAQKWFSDCEEEKEILWKEVHEELSLDRRTSSKELFLANNDQDVRTFRAGYYLGLSLVETFNIKNISLSDLLTIQKSEWYEYIEGSCT